MKKHLKALVIFFVLLALLTSSGAVSAFALNVEEVSLWDYDYYGDVNGDYNVTVKDATALQKYLAKLSDLDIFSRLKSDVNGDGKLSISDVTDVQKFVAVLIPCFEVDPAFRLVADRNSTIVEGFQEKVYITIPKDGYYCFSSEVSEPSYRAFEVLDGYDYVAGVAGEEPYLEDYAYVKAGLYRADVTFTNDDSRVFETELRVTSANDKMPVDLLNARELKDGDEIIFSSEVSNNAELLFFTNKNQCYKSRVADFEECKASVLGDFVAAKLQMDEGETAIFMAVVSEYKGYILVFFENGKVAKIDVSSYETKTNRKKLIKAYSDKSEPVAFRYITVDAEFIMSTTAGRYLCFNSGAISSKSAKDTQGVAVMTLKKGHKVTSVEDFSEDRFKKPARYRTKTLPSAGAVLSADDQGEQLSMTDAE